MFNNSFKMGSCGSSSTLVDLFITSDLSKIIKPGVFDPGMTTALSIDAVFKLCQLENPHSTNNHYFKELQERRRQSPYKV